MTRIARSQHSWTPASGGGHGVKAIVCAAMAFMRLMVGAQQASAQTTYRYHGNVFKFFSCGPGPEGGTKGCPDAPAPGNPLTTYLATDFVSATLTFSAPLPANLAIQDVTTRPGFSMTMSDGRQTLTMADVNVAAALVATDADGEIREWELRMSTPADPHTFSFREVTTTSEHFGTFIANQDGGTLACCDPFVSGNLASNQDAPGSWNMGTIDCAVQMNKASYVTGDAVVAQVFRFTNTASIAVPVEFKMWIEAPGFPPTSVRRAGADGSVSIAAHANVNIGPFTLFVVSASAPRGAYAFSCRLLDPVTGAVESASLQSFIVQ